MGVAKHVALAVASLVITAITYAYMTMLRVPSVLEVRPELADVGFVTGIFSGRSAEYLWLNFPIPMSVVSFLLVMFILELPKK